MWFQATLCFSNKGTGLSHIVSLAVNFRKTLLTCQLAETRYLGTIHLYSRISCVDA